MRSQALKAIAVTAMAAMLAGTSMLATAAPAPTTADRASPANATSPAAAPAATSLAPVPLTVQDAWIRAVPGNTMAAAYLTLHNTSSQPVTVSQISSPIARSAMIHETNLQGGQSRMRPHPDIAIPAGGSVKLEPGGLHVMLHDLTQPLTPGDKVPLLISWAPGVFLQVSATVRPISAD